MASNTVEFQIPTLDTDSDPECFTMVSHSSFDNINILRHNSSGNYFITGIVKLYNDTKEAEYGVNIAKLPTLYDNLSKAKNTNDDDEIAIAEAQLNIVEQTPKPIKVDIRVWFRIDTTKKFLTDLKTEGGYTSDQVAFKISKGPIKFRGIYVHKFVLNKFLDWMDTNYAIKVAKLLDRHLVEENEKLKMQIAQAQNSESKAKNRYKKLNKRFDEQSEQLKSQSEKIDKIIEYANALTSQNQILIDNSHRLQITADTTQEQLDENLTYTRQSLMMLEEKSLMKEATVDPKLITYYVVLVPKQVNTSKTRTIMVRGQMSRLDKVIEENSDDFIPYVSHSTHNVDLFINAQARFHQMVSDYIAIYNEPINERNQQLALTISDFNKLARMHNKEFPDEQLDLRSFNKEKEPLLCKKDIPITFGRTFIEYHSNEHFTYEQVISCIETIQLLHSKD